MLDFRRNLIVVNSCYLGGIIVLIAKFLSIPLLLIQDDLIFFFSFVLLQIVTPNYVQVNSVTAFPILQQFLVMIHI